VAGLGLLGTRQGAAKAEHLQSYLDEFIFRFNRRTARQRGLPGLRLLERAVKARPTRFVASPRPGGRSAGLPADASGPALAQPIHSTDRGEPRG